MSRTELEVGREPTEQDRRRRVAGSRVGGRRWSASTTLYRVRYDNFEYLAGELMGE
ncbi:MAG: hypothetical protein KKA42_05565 [candidate division Zixibacteria bacterium]|nr:hypothetical protein [candidate division Zixibacteria bacterium]